MAARIFTLILYMLIPAFYLSSQEIISEKIAPQHDYALEDTTQIELRSIQATTGTAGWTTTINSKGWRSDYYVFFQWSDLYWHCDCDHSYHILFYSGGKTYDVGTYYTTSYSGHAAKAGLGPSQYGTYTWKAFEGGHNDVIFLGCWGSCSGASWYQNNAYSFGSTARPRTPYSLTATSGKYDYRIDLTWKSDSDIPAANRYFAIYRDGTYLTSLKNAYSYSDSKLGPNETHTYTIYLRYNNSTTSGQVSYSASVTGKTFDLGLSPSTNQDGVINLTWNDAQTKGKAALEEYKIKRYDPIEEVEVTLPVYISKTTTDYPDDSENLIPGFKYKYTLIPQPDDKFYPDEAWGKAKPDGRLKGKILSPTGLPVQNVQVCAIRQDSLPQDTTTYYCSITDENGEFELQSLYYYKECDFKIIPKKAGHGFSPASSIYNLHIDQPWIAGITFTDTSAFTVSGQVIQIFAGDTCPVYNVELYVDDKEEPDAVTEPDGTYKLSVGQIGQYIFTPSLAEHGFKPEYLEYLVSSDTTVKTIIDTTTYTLSGYVLASCNTYIGQAQLSITSGTGPDYCVDSLIMTDTLTGYYEIELPARAYEINLNKFYSEHNDAEEAAVESYFATIAIDLTYGDTTIDYTYRSKPQFSISGFPDYGCGDYDGIPIVEQGYKYFLTLGLNDVFDDQSCPADTGMIIIQNNVGNLSNQQDTVYISGGVAQYSFVPGDPNLVAPHLKNLTLTAYLGTEMVSESVDIFVEGNRARESTFTTVSPEIPFLVLRDPPGDASFAYLNEATTSQTALRLSSQVAGSLNIWAEVKLGTKFQAGFFGNSVETDIWGKVRGSLEVGAAISGQSEYIMSITNTEIFKTSGNEDVTGESGDVFAGSALNLIYALTDVVDYNPKTCAADKTVSLIMGVEDFATTFIYTENHIRNVLIPQLAYLRDYYEVLENDSARIYANQVKVWNQTLKLNTDLKQRSKYVDNISFSSGIEYESSQEVSTTASGSLEFSMYVEAAVALEAGMEVAGSGASAGIEAKFRVELGSAISKSISSSKTTGFVLNDDDAGDAFSVDIREDNVFGTPIFKVVSGQSSCPWEPFTLPREDLQLTSDSYVEFVEHPSGQAVFHLQLGNTSQSDEDRIYNLVFDQASNPDGAVLTLGGSQVQGGIPTPYYVAASGSKQATITVEKGPEAFDYNDLQFTLFSGCNDESIRDTVLLDVHFANSCSPIELTQPQQDWILTSAHKNMMSITLSGYDKSLLDLVKIQMANEQVYNWQTIALFDKDELQPESTSAKIDIEEFKDAAYEVRAVMECESGKAFSSSNRGVLDRQPPELYGIPEPSDLSLDSGDVIMATFTEAVNCLKLSSDNVTVYNLNTGEILNSDFGCDGNTIIVMPDLSQTTISEDTFNVKIVAVEDAYGNLSMDTIGWSFVIKSDPTPPDDVDSDNDGYINSNDNCPYSANADQADMDNDGVGDICDDDIDGDGVPNISDNCLLVANSDQTDINEDGIGDACQDITEAEARAILEDNILYIYPNPALQLATFEYYLEEESHVVITIYDIIGTPVTTLVDKQLQPGTYENSYDVGNLPNGIYMANIKLVNEINEKVQTIKLIIISDK